MIRRKMLADGAMEIRLIGDDGELEAILELTKPTHHALFAAHLLDAQAEIRDREAGEPVDCQVIAFPMERVQSA